MAGAGSRGAGSGAGAGAASGAGGGAASDASGGVGFDDKPAGGVAVRQLVDPFDVVGGRTLLALLAIGGSLVLAVAGYLRWVGVQRAVRRGEPLPPAHLVPLLVVGLLGIAAVAFVLVAGE